MSSDLARELVSIRRRLERPAPGTINALRARQRIVLHQILAIRRCCEMAE